MPLPLKDGWGGRELSATWFKTCFQVRRGQHIVLSPGFRDRFLYFISFRIDSLIFAQMLERSGMSLNALYPNKFKYLIQS